MVEGKLQSSPRAVKGTGDRGSHGIDGVKDQLGKFSQIAEKRGKIDASD